MTKGEFNEMLKLVGDDAEFEIMGCAVIEMRLLMKDGKIKVLIDPKRKKRIRKPKIAEPIQKGE